MSAKTKTNLIVAASLVLVGCAIFGGVMMALGWNFLKLSTVKYDTNTYEISEEYQSISITTDTADITFVPSEDGKTTVTAFENESEKHLVTVQDGVLTVVLEDNGKWYDHIGIHFGSPKITVQLPEGQYGDLFIRASTADAKLPEGFTFEKVSIALSTGDIWVKGMTANALECSVSTGKITAEAVACAGDVQIAVSTGKAILEEVSCKNLTSRGGTGDLVLRNVVAQKTIRVERTTGDVKLDGCDAAELFLKTSTGDVEGSLLSEKVFLTETSTGTVRVPQTTAGGKCEIKTSTGHIDIQILP